MSFSAEGVGFEVPFRLSGGRAPFFTVESVTGARGDLEPPESTEAVLCPSGSESLSPWKVVISGGRLESFSGDFGFLRAKIRFISRRHSLNFGNELLSGFQSKINKTTQNAPKYEEFDT